MRTASQKGHFAQDFLPGLSPVAAAVEELAGAAYSDHYNILCKKLVQEQLYTSACVMLSPQTAIKSGAYEDMSELTSLKTFITTFAGHIAAEVARE